MSEYANLLLTIKHRRDIPRLINGLNLTGWGAEVGVLRGEFSAWILANTELSKFFSIDFWGHPSKCILTNMEEYISTVMRLSKFHNRSVPIKLEHKDAATLFGTNTMDFVYYDIGYNVESVEEGIETWWPKVAPGGLFCGHVFDQIINADKQIVSTNAAQAALDKFLDENGLKAHYTLEVPGRGTKSWIVRKPSDS